MARQCWDEARHVEISVKLSEHMGTELGEFSEQTLLFEAACNADPVLRLAGVNRALEGLAIDVFTTMRDFGGAFADPVLYFCEDWMLADEVTHVKMGSDWLRRITAKDPERQQRALDFQRTVDKLFSFGGFRGEEEENPVHLARKFRGLAGFTEDEISDLVDVAAEAYAEALAQAEAAAASSSPATLTAPCYALVLLDLHEGWAWFVIIGNGLAGAVGARRPTGCRALRTRALWWFTVVRRAGDLRAGRHWALAWSAGAEVRGAAVPHVLRLRRDHRRRHHLLRTAPRCAAACTCSTGSAACS